MKVDFKEEFVFLNGENVTDTIKKEKISLYSTEWATNLELKKFVRKYQKDFIKNNNVIMEGRDIGTRIAPNARVKFYLYSNFNTRVERKWKQNKNRTKKEIEDELLLLDRLDLNQGNFVKPSHAIEIDTTNITIDEVYRQMISIIDEKLKK